MIDKFIGNLRMSKFANLMGRPIKIGVFDYEINNKKAPGCIVLYTEFKKDNSSTQYHLFMKREQYLWFLIAKLDWLIILKRAFVLAAAIIYIFFKDLRFPYFLYLGIFPVVMDVLYIGINFIKIKWYAIQFPIFYLIGVIYFGLLNGIVWGSIFMSIFNHLISGYYEKIPKLKYLRYIKKVRVEDEKI